MPAAPLARVVRSGLEESVHLGHVAVCDADGRLVASAGDPDHLCYLRSCAKPIQGAVSLTGIGAELPDRLVAVMCASHNGEQVHVRAVRELLRLARLDASALRTPPGLPIDPPAARRAAGPTPLLHNCSGKHAGMLLACVRAGWSVETYRRRSHPLQRRVTATVRDVSGVDPVIGVDGCGVPVHAMPLTSIATTYARLSDPDRYGTLAPQVERVTIGMRAQPYVVGGRDRVDTTLMETTEDLVVKEGAEALACAVGLGAGLGIAVKVADGGFRAAGPALVSTLDQLGLLPRTSLRRVEDLRSPPVHGGGRVVGALEPVIDLRGRGTTHGRRRGR